MYKILLIILMFSFSSIACADTPYYVIVNQEEQASQPTTTPFSVDVATADVGLVTESLCYTTGTMNDCSEEKAKNVVIEFINEKVAQYQQAKTKFKKVDIQ